MKLSQEEIQKFKSLKKHFSLGDLSTEGFHPKSENLSELVHSDIDSAVKTLVEIDHDALDILLTYTDQIFLLSKQIQKVLSRGDRVYISGCGATGRLALSLEKLYREKFNSDQVISFMAGGDYALIKSVESFEDNFEYGKRQLSELGLTKNDLLIGITEGGETSFVIGTILHASKVCDEAPCFVYCNPDEELAHIERSNQLIKNDKVNKLNLSVGSMAISGSTRMQASTIQMLAVGMALLEDLSSSENFTERFERFIFNLKKISFTELSYFVNDESSLYIENEIITYITSAELAITVLTDTTERSPTFNMKGFEHGQTFKEDYCLCYLGVQGTSKSEQAWKKLLGRSPRCLNWDNLPVNIQINDLLNFDISMESINRRDEASKNKNNRFYINKVKNGIEFKLNDRQYEFKLNQSDLFFQHIALKLALNIQSTLVMGKLNRFHGNMMTYVKPSNLKLLDRSLRYIKHLLEGEQIDKTDKEIINILGEVHFSEDLPIVEACYQYILEQEK